MNREIKFRAKKLKTGEWLVGDLIKNSIIDPFTYIAIGIGYKDDDYRLGKPIKVLPGTVGQSTGLKDKNGTEIYEGDWLVVRELHDGDDCAWKQPTGPAIPCEVKWDDNYKCFDFGGCSRVIHAPSHFEVIGNIYENPELLERK